MVRTVLTSAENAPEHGLKMLNGTTWDKLGTSYLFCLSRCGAIPGGALNKMGHVGQAYSQYRINKIIKGCRPGIYAKVYIGKCLSRLSCLSHAESLRTAILCGFTYCLMPKTALRDTPRATSTVLAPIA